MDQELQVKIAVCVHAFYVDLLPPLLSYIRNINQPFDLFVSTVEAVREPVNFILEEFCALDATDRPANLRAVNVETVPNAGMDVLPFIYLVKKYDLFTYDVVLKIHTKNNASTLGRMLGKIALHSVLGSPQLVSEILSAFQSSAGLSMVGAHDLYRSAKHMMYNNRAIVQKLVQQLGLDDASVAWGFFGGTMFWIRAGSLRLLAEAYDWLCALSSAISMGREQTGRDGSVAHAIERIWGALQPSSSRQIGLVYRLRLVENAFLIRLDSDDVVLADPIRRIGITDILERWTKADDAVAALKRISGVDHAFYYGQSPECEAYGIDPELHYFVYGEILGLDPREDFSTAYYRINRPDVFRHGVSSLVHFRNHGRHEASVGNPQWDDWIGLAAKLNLFDKEWYRTTGPGVEASGLSSSEHYRTISNIVPAAPHANFVPDLIPLAHKADRFLNVADFLKDYYLKERQAYDELTRVIENNDFELVPELIDEVFAVFGVTAATVGALALACLKLGDWANTTSLLSYHWAASERDLLPVRHTRSITSRSRLANEIFEDVEVTPVSRDIGSVCVYTALFGDIDSLPSVLCVSRHCRFICFTDRAREASGWEYRICNPGLDDHNLNAKIFKIFPDMFATGFDYTLFVDANTLLCGNLDELLEHYLFGQDFVMFRHPERGDIYEEGVAIIEARRHPPAAILAQLRHYSDKGLPFHAGLVEASFIWRASNRPNLHDLMNEWWEHILQHSKRDQISLGYLMWSRDFRPKVLPPSLGTSRNNSYFTKLPHLKLPTDVSTSKPSSSSSEWSRKADIWFLYGSNYVNAGSTILRGLQLQQIVARSLGGSRGVFYTSFDDIENSIVVASKGYIAQHGVAGLTKLREAKNFIIADFVDARPSAESVACVDVLLASSIRAYIDYRGRYPNVRTHHVTHHVDLRIPRHDSPGHFQAGYFGEIVNTIMSKSLEEIVDFVSVDTSVTDTGWISRLPEYSLHYAVRKRRGLDHHKPFLKGFVAAHCRSNILIQRDAGDAMYYLGENYPYLIGNEAGLDEIVSCLHRAKDDFGGPEWRAALAVMDEVYERSNTDWVASEMNNLLRTL